MARLGIPGRRSFARPIVWAALSVLVAAVVVQTTRSGIDILALLVAGFVLLLIERTLGDWVADTLGPVPTTLIFAAVAAVGVTYITTDTGRGRARRLFAAADARGYHTAYFSLGDSDGGRGTAADDAVVAASDTLTRPLSAPPPLATPAPSQSTTSPAPTPGGTSTTPVPTIGRETAPGRDAPGHEAASAAAAASGGAPGKPAAGVRIARLSVSPDVGVVAQPIVFRAVVALDSPGTLPEVEFSVGGRSLAVVKPDADGIATAQWKTMVPGQYVVRARLSGSGLVASATLNVLPGTR